MAYPYFDAAAYLANNADLDEAGITLETAEQHYLDHGAAEAAQGAASRNPTAWFDVQHYLSSHPDLEKAGVTPAAAFQHFIDHGMKEGLTPNASIRLDDAGLEAYATNNEDLRKAFNIDDASALNDQQKFDLAQHYYQHGHKEGRSIVPAEGEETSTLTEGLEAITKAEAAVEAFIQANTKDVDEDGKGDGNAKEITDAMTAAAGKLDTAITAITTAPSKFATDSAALRAAYLDDAKAKLAKDLAAAQKTLAEKQAAVDKTPGLNSAVTAYEAAVDAADAAAKAQAAAYADLAAEDVRYENNANVTIGIVGGAAADAKIGTAITAVNNGTIDLIVRDAKGNLVLNTDPAGNGLVPAVSEATHPGVTALLNAAKAYNVAVTASDSADALQASALIEVGVLDTAGNNAALLSAVVGLMGTGVTAPTWKEIQTFQTKLENGVATLKSAIESVKTTGTSEGDTAAEASVKTLLTNAVTAGYINAVQSGAILSAFETLDSTATTAVTIEAAILAATTELGKGNASLAFNAAVSNYTADAIAPGNNKALDALQDAKKAIYSDAGTPDDSSDDTGIQAQIDSLTKAASNAQAALTTADELKALNDKVKAAYDAIEDAGYELPVLLTGNVAASAGDDIFIAGTANASIANFNLLGSDTLFIGTGYTLNEGKLADGDNSVLEVFLSEVNGNATITLEQEVFGSNSSDPETVITLTGVSLADVVLSDGFVTVA